MYSTFGQLGPHSNNAVKTTLGLKSRLTKEILDLSLTSFVKHNNFEQKP